MVYINSLNAFLSVGLIILLSSFILFVAYLWVNNLENQADESIKETIEDTVCNCLGIISDNGAEIVVMNVRCSYAENLSLTIGNESYTINETLYYEDFAVISYSSDSPYIIFNYNSCYELFNK